jgi:multidrug efflux pump subunit AcrB
MSPIPINASMGMFISLAMAFVITPWLALKADEAALRGMATATERRRHGRLDRLFRRIMTPLLDPQTGGAARRKLWIGVLVAIVLSVSLGGLQLVVLKMLPFDNKSEFQVVLDMPVGTPLEETAKVLREISARSPRCPRCRLPGLRRHRQPDQLQRPGAPVLPAQRARAWATSR